MTAIQENVDRALAIRDEVTKVIRSIGRRGYNGEKVDIESAQEIAERLISIQYLDLNAIAAALDPDDKEN